MKEHAQLLSNCGAFADFAQTDIYFLFAHNALKKFNNMLYLISFVEEII